MPNWLLKIVTLGGLLTVVFALFRGDRGPSDSEVGLAKKHQDELKDRVDERHDRNVADIEKEVASDLADLDADGDSGFMSRAFKHWRTDDDG